MGVDHNGYIGPYLRVTDTVKNEQVDRCRNHNCPADALYCPKCGTSKQSRVCTIEVGSAPDNWEENYIKNGQERGFWEFLCNTSHGYDPDTNESGKRTNFYLPNCHFKELNIPVIEGGKYSEEEVPFDELDIPVIKEKFIELFADEIAHLKQWFEVEVKFGYIGWCS